MITYRDKEYQALLTQKFITYMWEQHHIHQGIDPEGFQYFELDYGGMTHLDLIGYMLDFLLQRGLDKSKLVMKANFEEYFCLLSNLMEKV